ncbi:MULTISPECIES: CidA/LrgA family protein [Anaerococcus]|jgi:lrgA family protein|uniref:CidA/LrgA family protein n=1 Tax=Anaerococcus nagyae TaxID=1755241 RepID=A0A3E2TIK9_9FIRM|nr:MULTISPECIES: CidA/LrgA family protein [Anaerococcus]MBP2069828.1 holin-like protein [Anaerococcus nagyae]MDU1828370.1 CidA/LrgA family protein [Anaerococcus sp.]MDU1863728.1 CidA/LrgA family protein [Anaerococcus sp.]MDU2353234.1 CidA/LrgA family protein [Anaerococcus sp.]MDU2565738.1 CidA/LrgA family protein [Anaerococcus sp.]
MNYLKEFVILCACLLLGSLTRKAINFPIPEAVYGMIYLFIALRLNILKPEEIEKTSNGILANLAFLFVPVGVGIMANYEVIQGRILKLVIIVLVGTAVTMGVTGIIVQSLQRRKK